MVDFKYGLPVPEDVIEQHLAANDRDTSYIAREAARAIADGVEPTKLGVDELEALCAVCETALRELHDDKEQMTWE